MFSHLAVFKWRKPNKKSDKDKAKFVILKIAFFCLDGSIVLSSSFCFLPPRNVDNGAPDPQTQTGTEAQRRDLASWDSWTEPGGMKEHLEQMVKAKAAQGS